MSLNGGPIHSVDTYEYDAYLESQVAAENRKLYPAQRLINFIKLTQF